VPQAVIDNPILNSAFSEPTRHFRFGDEGITNDIVDKRRTSSYFIPIAQRRIYRLRRQAASCRRVDRP